MPYRSIITISVIAVVAGLAMNAYPGMIACAVSGESDEYAVAQKQLLSEAMNRIEAKFGALHSKPVIVFFDKPDSFWPLTLNEYGSTSFLGYKTCVAIGPKGQNIDVTAHELMHAEIEHRLGYWVRWVELPTWFDEGLAMQVDYRKRYDLPTGTETSYVKELNTGMAFFVSDDQRLTNHYASAKSEVASLVLKVGEDSVYDHLFRMKSGEEFSTVWFGEH